MHDDHQRLAAFFEEQRPRLRTVAYRMLGSLSEADDAVQEGWLRLSRTDTRDIANLAGWLTTVVGRICLDLLRARRARREEPLAAHVPDPIVTRAGHPATAPHGPFEASGASGANGANAGGGAWDADPEHAALLTDSVGLALLVVLDTLDPAERLAFVLHDMFAVPFADIASVLGRSPAATRQLASRARRRVRQEAPAPEDDPARRRKVVEAFLTAARGGDFDALVAVLDPDVVLRADTGKVLAGTAGAGGPVRGAAAVAGRALAFRRFAAHARPALVNGALGLLTVRDGRPVAVMAFAITGGRVHRIDILADPARLARLDLPPLTP